MLGLQISQESLADDRIEKYQSPRRRETQILRSPGGLPVARTFSVEVNGKPDAHTYSIAERHRLVEQLQLVVRDFYVHLPMKIAQYGYDAVRALERLAPAIERLSDEEFHQAVIQLITRTRDRHLAFYGRTPNGVSAVLPFQIERCWIDDAESYVVSKVSNDYTPQHLEPGAIVTHWNGTPIARHIRLMANLFDGGNESASLARSLEFLTQRPLSRFAWPIESWVDLTFTVNDTQHVEQFHWDGFDIGVVPVVPGTGRNVIGFGGDLDLFQNQLVKRAEFSRGKFDEIKNRAVTPSSDGTPTIVGRKNNFDYGLVATSHGTFAYIRLYHFGASDVDDIALDMIAAFEQIPRNGLIIDMRGNSGGYIAAGERLLQLFTPRRITPTRFQFRVTPGTIRMMSSTPYFDIWKQSFDEAQLTGEAFSQGYPIEGTDNDANQLGQRYFGPVVVVTDALAFSTADMFVAGFIDHSIGRVICIDKNMAAAGGNNWQFDVLRLFVPAFKLDVALKHDLDGGNVSTDLRDDFNRNGLSLPGSATNSGPISQFGGTLWRISDGAIQHEIRHVPWMSDELNVYPGNDAGGLRLLPNGLLFGFTVRRCVRTGPNEGRLLEDLGIRPDVNYKLTLRDVLESNQDLVARATLELSQMPAYDLRVDVSDAHDGSHLISCQTTNLSDLEVLADERHLQSFSLSTSPIEFKVPSTTHRLRINAYHHETQVVSRVVQII